MRGIIPYHRGRARRGRADSRQYRLRDLVRRHPRRARERPAFGPGPHPARHRIAHPGPARLRSPETRGAGRCPAPTGGALFWMGALGFAGAFALSHWGLARSTATNARAAHHGGAHHAATAGAAPPRRAAHAAGSGRCCARAPGSGGGDRQRHSRCLPGAGAALARRPPPHPGRSGLCLLFADRSGDPRAPSLALGHRVVDPLGRARHGAPGADRAGVGGGPPAHARAQSPAPCTWPWSSPPWAIWPGTMRWSGCRPPARPFSSISSRWWAHCSGVGLLGEPLTLYTVVGGGLILAGLSLDRQRAGEAVR